MVFSLMFRLIFFFFFVFDRFIEVFFFLFIDLCKNTVDGFSAGLVDEENVFEWSVSIIGPPDTL